MSATTIWILDALRSEPWYFTNEAEAVAAYEAAVSHFAKPDWERREYLDGHGYTLRQCTACTWNGRAVTLRARDANVPWEAP